MRIGVDLGGTKIEAAVLAASGQIVIRKRMGTPRGDYAATVEAVAKVAEECEAAAGTPCTVGVGIPGAISPASGNSAATFVSRASRSRSASMSRRYRAPHMDLAAQPHHDGSPRYLDDQAPDLGDRVGVRLRVPAAIGAEAVHVRAVVDGEPKYTKATICAREPGDDGAVWWHADVTIRNPVTPYRFLVESAGGVRWVNGAGSWHRDVGDRDDFVVATFPPPPEWLADSVCYEIFPDRFARGID